MIKKQNLHTHSTCSDGRHTPRALVALAMERGLDSIGFSEHSYMWYAPEETLEKPKPYIAQIRQLKKEYENEIAIFCGIESDMYSATELSQFDYAIGSVHYLKIGNEYVGFDRSADRVQQIIDTCFGGDGMAYARKYYETLAQLPQYGQFDIIGHFDLVAKHCETTDFFDVNSQEYLSYAFAAARALAGKIPYFEVNTGGIARGYRNLLYPAVPIVKELHRLGFGAVISSDCHDGHQLDACFDQAEDLLRQCGFRERYVLTDSGFLPVPLS